jgi:hypothetical protein
MNGLKISRSNRPATSEIYTAPTTPNGIAMIVARKVTTSDPVINGRRPNDSFWKDTGIQRPPNNAPRPGDFANGAASFPRKRKISATMRIAVDADPVSSTLIAFSFQWSRTIYLPAGTGTYPVSRTTFCPDGDRQ